MSLYTAQAPMNDKTECVCVYVCMCMSLYTAQAPMNDKGEWVIDERLVQHSGKMQAQVLKSTVVINILLYIVVLCHPST